MYGQIEIGGRKYIEREQVFPAEQAVTVSQSLTPNLRVVLPGVANFLLKGLTREVLDNNGTPVTRRFRFRLGNTDGGVWYTAAGLGGTNDRVLDSLMFGDGQFPFPIIPPIFYSSSASILFEVEDVSQTVPYTIFFAFHGSYLIPTQEQ